MTDQHWAVIGTAAIVISLYALMYVILRAFELDQYLAHLGAFVTSMLAVQETYKHCEKEARSTQGDSHADRKD